MAHGRHTGNDQELKESLRLAIVQVEAEQLLNRGFTYFQCHQFDLPGDLTVYDIIIDPVVINRKAMHIGKDENDDYFLTTMRYGKAVIEQQGVCYTMKAGDLALMAAGLPYLIKYTQRSHRLIVRIPNHVFKERLVSTDQHLVIGKLPSDGIGLVVNDLLKLVASDARKLPVTDQYTLSQSLLELTGALTRALIKKCDITHESRHPGLFNRVMAYIEGHYMDPSLTPKMIAEANGISTRYLHTLFRQSGKTVLRWVWERRLKAARSDLLDPTQAQRRISEIAFRQGFNDSAHFSRSFRNRFGISATELRQRAATTKSPDATPHI